VASQPELSDPAVPFKPAPFSLKYGHPPCLDMNNVNWQ
jgi:hypothetical protein